MPYDTHVGERLRAAVRRAHPAEEIAEKHMFGGLALLLGGRMACGVQRDELVVRVPEARFAAALTRPHARPMDFTGRPLRGFVYVAPAGFEREEDLDAWVALGLAAARVGPKKTAKKKG